MKEKTKYRVRILVVALAAALALGCFATALLSRFLGVPAAADEGGSFESSYMLDTQLAVPAMTITVNGQSYDAEVIVHYPSGLAYNSSSVTLSEAGRYRVEKRAQVGGRMYSEYETFNVYSPLYEVTGGMTSSAKYEPSYVAPSVNGINVQLESGAVFHYNRIIDLAELGSEKTFIETIIAPQTLNEQDVLTLWIVLTDAHDPDNEIRIKCSASRDGIGHGVTYIQAGATDQPTVGGEWNLDKVHENNIYGFPVSCSFYGAPQSGIAMENNGISLRFDVTTNQLLATQAAGGRYDIVDFDDPQYFDEVWGGFTTGEVFLSLYAADYQKTMFGIEIKSIAGQDLSGTILEDQTKPVITVDYGAYEEASLPVGLAGNPYPLFAASATDDYSDPTLDVNVYSDYAGRKISCYVEDGVFYPDRAGTYTIEYSAADAFGNTATETVEIEIAASVPALTLTVEEDGRVTSGYIGTEIEVSDASASGGVGETGVRIVAVAPDGSETVVEGGSFIPRSTGKYTILYTAYDFVSQQQTDEYTLEVGYGADPVFEGDVELPRYFLTGFEYTLPSFPALNYTENGVFEIASAIRVSVAGEETTLGSAGKITFSSSSAVSEVIVTYYAQTSTGTARKPYTVPLYNVRSDTFHMENYFALEGNMTRSVTEDYVAVTTASEGARTTFVNPLLAYDFSLTFSVSTARNNFSRVNIYLADSESGETLKFSYAANGRTSYFYINDGDIGYPVASSFATGSEFQFRFDNSLSRVLASSDTSYISVGSTLDGAAFSGFESGLVYLTVEFENVTGQSELQFININSQTLSSTPIDRVTPRVAIIGDYGGAVDYGSSVTLNPVAYADVLDPFPTISMAVYAPDGTAVTAQDGTLLEGIFPGEYVFTASQYGTYRIEYSVSDSSGRSRTLSYDILVDDTVAPEITVDGTIPSECAQGDTVVIPSVTATDNHSAAEVLTVYIDVILPTGRIMHLPQGSNSFAASEAGTYTVRITVYDEAGNMAAAEYSVTAREVTNNEG